jgi:hypothetical protein
MGRFLEDAFAMLLLSFCYAFATRFASAVSSVALAVRGLR